MSLPLHTARLEIREFRRTDLEDLAAIFADPRVLWWEPEPFTRERTREWIAATLARYRDDGCGEYAIVLAASQTLIGDCGPAYREIAGERLPELGWDLHPDHWGRGYATEAARAVLVHVREIGIPRVYSLITPGNVRSRGVARHLGMTIDRRVTWAERIHDLWALDVA